MNATKSLKRRFGFNVASQAFSQLVTLAYQLLLVPFFIHYWGVELYADWIVLSTVPILLGMLDFGVANASANAAIKLYAGGDTRAAATSLRTALAFVTAICVALISVAVFVLPSTDFTRLLHLGKIDAEEARHLLGYLVVYLCTNLIAQQILSWFKTIDQTALGVTLLACRRLIEVGASIALLALHARPVALAQGLCGAQLIFTAIIGIVGFRMIRLPVLNILKSNWTVFGDLARPSAAFVMLPMAQLATVQFGVQILNVVAPASQVVAFVMVRTLTRIIMQFASTMNAAIVPESARHSLANSGVYVQHFTKRIAARVSIVALLAYLLLILTGPAVVATWSKGAVVVDRLTVSLIGAHALVHAMWIVRASFSMSNNQHFGLSAIYFGVSIVGILGWLALSGCVTPYWGGAAVLLLPECAAACFIARKKNLE